MAFDVKEKDEPDTRSELECFPIIDPGVEVVGDRVLVQLRREKTTSKGGMAFAGQHQLMRTVLIIVSIFLLPPVLLLVSCQPVQ